MAQMNRRRFLARTAAGIGAMALPGAGHERLRADPTGKRFTAFDKRPVLVMKRGPSFAATGATSTTCGHRMKPIMVKSHFSP